MHLKDHCAHCVFVEEDGHQTDMTAEWTAGMLKGPLRLYSVMLVKDGAFRWHLRAYYLVCFAQEGIEVIDRERVGLD